MFRIITVAGTSNEYEIGFGSASDSSDISLSLDDHESFFLGKEQKIK